MSKRSARLSTKCNVWIGFSFFFKKNLIETIGFIYLGRSIEYQLIHRKRPNVIELHDEKVNKSSTTNWVFFQVISEKINLFQQIFDHYDWLKNESEQKNWILKNENFTLSKYLGLNTQKNDWTEVRRKFHNSIDYELFSDVQLLDDHVFYSYKNCSKSMHKSWVKIWIS